MGDHAHQRIAEALEEQIGGELKELAKNQARIKSRLRTIDKKIRNMLDNITAVNRDLIDTRVGELALERDRLEAKLESLAHLVLSAEELKGVVAETSRFVDSLPASLTEAPIEDRQAAIRRCVDHVVVDRAHGALGIDLRRIPAIAGGPIPSATQTRAIQLNGTVAGSPG